MTNNRWRGLALILLLVGCQANHDSLEEFVAETERASRQQIPPLKPITPFEVYRYTQQNEREPFELPREAAVQRQPSAKKDCWQPKTRTRNQPLQGFALSQLSFKGVMSSGGNVSALMQTPQGRVIKVQKGQFVGLNQGQVTQIDRQYVVIKETLPDGLGCWSQRSVKLNLK